MESISIVREIEGSVFNKATVRMKRVHTQNEPFYMLFERNRA